MRAPGAATAGTPSASGLADRALVRYAAATGITVVAILSQYFVPQTWPSTVVVYGNLLGDVGVVYGLPIAAFLLLVGVGPLRHATEHLGAGAWQGLRWYGSMVALALVVVTFLGVIYAAVDPSALKLLSRENPALAQAASDPWFYVAFSFAVGAIEETIFRGWIFGFWIERPGSWLVPALWTSALFAGVHLYYGLTYLAASPIFYAELFLIGFGFAAARRSSKGNLVAVAALHGLFDAASYLSLVSQDAYALALYVPVAIGLLIALYEYGRTPEVGGNRGSGRARDLAVPTPAEVGRDGAGAPTSDPPSPPLSSTPVSILNPRSLVGLECPARRTPAPASS